MKNSYNKIIYQIFLDIRGSRNNENWLCRKEAGECIRQDRVKNPDLK